MRKSLLGLVFLLLIVVLVSSQAFAVPKMQLNETSFDFGFVPQNSKVSHVFWIKSVGDDTLKILKVKPGWGCTKAPLKKKELAVGDSTELEIIYSTGSKSGPAQKKPSITTNEGPPAKRVAISVNSVRQPDSTYPIIFKPYKLFVSRAGEVEVDEASFTITNVSDEDLDLSLVSQPYGYFQLDLPETIKAGEAAECKLKVNPEYLDTAFEKSITVELSDITQTRFSLPVIRRLIGAGARQSHSSTGH